MVAITSTDESARVEDDETVELDGQREPADSVEVWEIEARAYELHLSDAQADALDNWLRAERELLAERSGASQQGAALS
jgi:hypothetical protein